MSETYTCRKVARGVTEGEVLISREPILFYTTDPETGVITEPGHCLEGVSVKDKIIVMPSGKGSSVVQADGMYRLSVHGTAPRGIIVKELDTVLVSCAVIMEMPMVFRLEDTFYERVRDGQRIRIEAGEESSVTIL